MIISLHPNSFLMRPMKIPRKLCKNTQSTIQIQNVYLHNMSQLHYQHVNLLTLGKVKSKYSTRKYTQSTILLFTETQVYPSRPSASQKHHPGPLWISHVDGTPSPGDTRALSAVSQHGCRHQNEPKHQRYLRPGGPNDRV
jgi:hypothetical protein